MCFTMQKNRLCRCGWQPSTVQVSGRGRGRARRCCCSAAAAAPQAGNELPELSWDRRRNGAGDWETSDGARGEVSRVELRRCASSADRVYGQLLSAHNVRGMKNAAWTWNRSLDFLHERILKVSVSRRRRCPHLHSCKA